MIELFHHIKRPFYHTQKPPEGSSLSTPLNKVTISIRNIKKEILPYNQCACMEIYINSYSFDISVELPKGIRFGDSYGRVQMAYGKGKRVVPYEELISESASNLRLHNESRLLYYFDDPNCGAEFRFVNGRLKSIDYKNYAGLELSVYYPNGFMEG